MLAYLSSVNTMCFPSILQSGALPPLERVAARAYDALLMQGVGDAVRMVVCACVPIILWRMLKTAEFPRFGRTIVRFAAVFFIMCGVELGLRVLLLWYPIERFAALWGGLIGVVSMGIVWRLPGLLREAQTAFHDNARYMPLVDVVSDGHWSFNVATGEDWVSDRYLETLGYSRFDNDLEAWAELIHPEDRQTAIDAIITTVETGQPFRTLIRLCHATKGYVWRLDRGVAFKNEKGEVIRVMGAHADVTELKNAQAKAERLARDAEEFVHIASHDLKEPLRSATMALGLIFSDTVSQADKEAYKDRALESLSRGQDRIEAIRDMGRASKSTVRKRVKVAEALAGMLTDHTAKLIALQVSPRIVILPGAHIITCDPELFTLGLSNLFSNALKYHHEPTEDIDIEIRIKPVYTIGREHDAPAAIILQITDNGIGIKPRHLAKALAPLSRLHTVEKYDGTGMGLSIVQKIVQAHKGTFQLSSTGDNEGTTARMEIPQ